jgi:uncharacterized protein YjbI with pentapeptide repeats
MRFIEEVSMSGDKILSLLSVEGGAVSAAVRIANEIARRNMKCADRSGEDFTGKRLRDLNGMLAIFEDTVFDEADLTDSSFMLATLWATRFNGATLSQANLSYADAWNAQFVGARMENANLTGFHGREAVMRGAILNGATLQGAQCWRVDFRRARMRSACLKFGQFRESDFRGSDLREADLSHASFWDCLFNEETRLEGAVLTGVDCEPLRRYASQSSQGV